VDRRDCMTVRHFFIFERHLSRLSRKSYAVCGCMAFLVFCFE
jgi:hypothetical protein